MSIINSSSTSSDAQTPRQDPELPPSTTLNTPPHPQTRLYTHTRTCATIVHLSPSGRRIEGGLLRNRESQRQVLRNVMCSAVETTPRNAPSRQPRLPLLVLLSSLPPPASSSLAVCPSSNRTRRLEQKPCGVKRGLVRRLSLSIYLLV